MEHKHKFISAEDAWAYIIAGQAQFTLKSLQSGKHYTYKVTAKKYGDKPFLFVSVLCGHMETSKSYAYIGRLDLEKGFMRTPKARLTVTDRKVIAFKWTINTLVKGILPELLEIWHHGHCGRCGKLLTVPKSIQLGLGPYCRKM